MLFLISVSRISLLVYLLKPIPVPAAFPAPVPPPFLPDVVVTAARLIEDSVSRALPAEPPIFKLYENSFVVEVAFPRLVLGAFCKVMH